MEIRPLLPFTLFISTHSHHPDSPRKCLLNLLFLSDSIHWVMQPASPQNSEWSSHSLLPVNYLHNSVQVPLMAGCRAGSENWLWMERGPNHPDLVLVEDGFVLKWCHYRTYWEGMIAALWLVCPTSADWTIDGMAHRQAHAAFQVCPSLVWLLSALWSWIIRPGVLVRIWSSQRSFSVFWLLAWPCFYVSGVIDGSSQWNG